MEEYELTDLMTEVLQANGSVDIANREWTRRLHDDPDLAEEYAEWCHAKGYLEKRGFLEFADEFKAEQDSKYDSLTDYVD